MVLCRLGAAPQPLRHGAPSSPGPRPEASRPKPSPSGLQIRPARPLECCPSEPPEIVDRQRPDDATKNNLRGDRSSPFRARLSSGSCAARLRAFSRMPARRRKPDDGSIGQSQDDGTLRRRLHRGGCAVVDRSRILTKAIVDIAAPLGISVHDHITQQSFG
jgi:hypothetical protein